jgi:cyanophycin synthetase
VKRVLVKPAEGSLAKGVQANLSLEEAQAHILSNPTVTFAVEEFIRGTEYRVYTVGDEPVFSYMRLPKHVIGDGTSTIDALIDKKIYLQRRNPRSWNRALDRDEALAFLQKHGVSPDHVPPKGTLVRLTGTLYWESLDSLDCTGTIDREITDMAVRAAKVFGLGFSAVDLMQSQTGKIFVLEVNARPGLNAAAFPLNATWTLRLPEAILRAHFPRLDRTPRRVKRFDFLQLVSDYRAKTDVTEFDAADYVDYV